MVSRNVARVRDCDSGHFFRELAGELDFGAAAWGSARFLAGELWVHAALFLLCVLYCGNFRASPFLAVRTISDVPRAAAGFGGGVLREKRARIKDLHFWFGAPGVLRGVVGVEAEIPRR